MFVLYGGVDDADIESQLRGQLWPGREVLCEVSVYRDRPLGVMGSSRYFDVFSSALEATQAGGFTACVLDLRASHAGMPAHDGTRSFAAIYAVMGRFDAPMALLVEPQCVAGLQPVVSWMSAHGSLFGVFTGANCESRALRWVEAMILARLP